MSVTYHKAQLAMRLREAAQAIESGDRPDFLVGMELFGVFRRTLAIYGVALANEVGRWATTHARVQCGMCPVCQDGELDPRQTHTPACARCEALFEAEQRELEREQAAMDKAESQQVPDVTTGEVGS